MNECPLVSVILPIYNVEQYLRTCIDSVIAQEYQNIEIILVEDGATDSSATICDEYAKKDERVQVIHQQNAGLSSARNSGLNKANGEYLFFLDSDDCIHPQLLKLAVQTALNRDVRIVQVELEMVPSDFVNYKKDIRGEFPIHEFNRVESIYNLDQDNQEYGKDIRLTTTVVWSKLYHKSIFSHVKFVEGIRIHEDQLVVHRFLYEGNGMCFIEEPLYFYRANANSLIRKPWNKEKLIILDCYKDRLQCVLNLPDGENGKTKIINLIYRRYLICMIKNYMMVLEHVKDKSRNEILGGILRRFREEYSFRYSSNLTIKDKMIFRFFSMFPSVAIMLYKRVN